MKFSEREVIAKRVVHYYVNSANYSKPKTVRHFTDEGEKRRTVYSILKRYDMNGTVLFKKTRSRKCDVFSQKVMNKVKHYLLVKGFSERQIATKLGIHQPTVHKIKVRLGIKSNKCVQIPKHNENQKIRAKTNSRKVYRKSINKVLILDDETYVMFDPKNIPGSKWFHFIDKSLVDDSLRFKTEEKFPKRYLIWQAIDEFGNISEPYIKFGTLKAEEYRIECLEKRLIPFIKRYHPNSDVLFWPDLASIHYEKSVQNCLKDNNIEFVAKECNPPNVPNARPIEKFWNLCKRMYGQRSDPPKNLKGFKIIWNDISKKVAETYAQTLMKNIRRRLKLIGNEGVLAPFKTKF